MNVLFVCVANGGRSVMAERLFRRAARGRHEARSAGSEPGAAPHPQVVEALRELGIDASDHVPRRLDEEALAWADVAVSTCSEEVCPATPGVRRIAWVFDDPKSLPLERVREIRDEIERSVDGLVAELDREGGAREQPGRRAGIASLLMIPALLVSFVLAELAGAGLQAAFGLADDESLKEGGVLGVLAGVALTALLVAPPAIGSVLGARARRLGARRLGTWGFAVNAAIGVYVVVVSVLGLVLG